MKVVTLFLFFALVFAKFARAHEGDHDAPGALPFAPHGGKAAEASEVEGEEDHDEDHGHEDEHEHEHANEQVPDKKNEKSDHAKTANAKAEAELEYFFEATYSNGKLTIYPLAFDETKPKEFLPVKVEGALSNLRILAKFPRSNRTEKVAMNFVHDEKRGDHWQGEVPPSKDIRFYANIYVNWQGVERESRIHLEKRK